MKVEEVQIEGYSILEKIGKGTYGKVYKAQDQATEKIVALKIMSLNVFSFSFLKYLEK